MKTCILALLLTSVCVLRLPAQDTPDAHVQKLADIRRMLVLSGGDKAADQILDIMVANFKNSAPGSEDYMVELKKELGGSKMIDMMVEIYDKYLSTEDVKGIIQFYESPAGKKMIESAPRIVEDSIAQASEISRRVFERVQQQKQGK